MKITLVLCLAVLLGACAAPQPRADFDPKADFSHLHSFAWFARDPLYQPHDIDRPLSLLNRSRVVDQIESTLLSQGYVKVDKREEADFLVGYGVGTNERINVSTYGDPLVHRWGYGWGWGWPAFERDVDVRSYTAGRLYIDVLTGPKHQPIWHGVSQEELGQADLDVAGERLPRVVASVLARFPPH